MLLWNSSGLRYRPIARKEIWVSTGPEDEARLSCLRFDRRNKQPIKRKADTPWIHDIERFYRYTQVIAKTIVAEICLPVS